MIQKITLLKQFLASYGMKVNASKTIFFIICVTERDKNDIRVGDLVVEPCAQYTYLGSVFMADGSIPSRLMLKVRCHISVNLFHS